MKLLQWKCASLPCANLSGPLGWAEPPFNSIIPSQLCRFSTCQPHLYTDTWMLYSTPSCVCDRQARLKKHVCRLFIIITHPIVSLLAAKPGDKPYLAIIIIGIRGRQFKDVFPYKMFFNKFLPQRQLIYQAFFAWPPQSRAARQPQSQRLQNQLYFIKFAQIKPSLQIC